MGIIDRISTLLKSNINDLISRAENPEKVLLQLITDMRGQLAKAKQEVAAAIADEKKLYAQVQKEKEASDEWERKAMLAVEQGRDDLAKQALIRHNEHLQHAQALHEIGSASGNEQLLREASEMAAYSDDYYRLLRRSFELRTSTSRLATRTS